MSVEEWIFKKWSNRAWFMDVAPVPPGKKRYLQRCRNGRIRFWVGYLRHVKDGEGLKSPPPNDLRYPENVGRGWETVASRKQLRKISAGKSRKRRERRE